LSSQTATSSLILERRDVPNGFWTHDAAVADAGIASLGSADELIERHMKPLGNGCKDRLRASRGVPFEIPSGTSTWTSATSVAGASRVAARRRRRAGRAPW
jgi:hypothetical protein